MPRERLTACLIVQNEREHLPAALASVDFCDEIIVVDGGSTDGTPDLARGHGARVVENPWPGFSKQRNLALDAATSEWVLEVDADEQVSPRLRQSIEAMLLSAPDDTSIAVFALRSHFLGKALGPSAKYPAYRARLFRRSVYRHDESREVHEGIYPQERPLVLDGDLDHELASTLREAIGDMWRYAQLESRHLSGASGIGYLTGIALRPTAKLLYRLTVERGWRDGAMGLLKIFLDVSSDSLVWLLVLSRQLRRTSDDSPPASAEHAMAAHFGRRSKGPAKVVGLALSGDATGDAAAWLAGLREHGVDVALVTARNGFRSDVPARTVSRLTPLAVLRAVQDEGELRPIDALVAVGWRARLLRSVLPPPLRPEIAGVDAARQPSHAAQAAIDAVADR